MRGAPQEKQPATIDLFEDLNRAESVRFSELIAEGTSNKEIGQKLFLTEKTIKHYVTNILQKLHVSNRVQVALIAQQKTKLK